jgi:hypothetical protein
MADDLNDVIERAALDLQSMVDTGFIPEDDEGLYEAFGGKKGAGKVDVPDKLSDKQILAYFDFIGTPLTSKSEKASVIDAIRQKQQSAPSMSIADKIKNQTLTIGEAIEMGPEGKRGAVRKAVEAAGKSLDDAWSTIGDSKFLTSLNEVGSEATFTTLATVQTAIEKASAANDLPPPPNIFKAEGKARGMGLEKAKQARKTKVFKQVPGAQQSLPALTEGIAAIKDADTRAAVAFNALVPLRPGEVAKIKLDDFDFEAGRFTDEYRRGNKIRNALDIPEVSLEILRDAAEKARAEGREYIFNTTVSKMTAGVKAPGGIAERFKPFETILGRKIEGVKDIRKIIPSIIANELGYAPEASTILGHDNFDDTIEGLKGITSKHYVSQVMTQEGTTAKQALRALQNMYGEVLGLSTLNELPASMGVTAAGLEAVEAPRLAVIPKGQDIVGTQVQGKLTDADLDLIDDVREARSQELKLTATQAEAERLRLEAQMPEIDKAAIQAKEERRLLEQTIKKEVRSKITAESATDPLSTIPEEDVDKLKKLGLWERFGGKLAVGTLAGLGTYSFLTDPAQAAVDVGLEVGARALGAAAGPAAAVPMALAPTELGDATLRPEDRMEAIAIQDSGMQLKPEARQDFIPAPEVEDDNFITMNPN